LLLYQAIKQAKARTGIMFYSCLKNNKSVLGFSLGYKKIILLVNEIAKAVGKGYS
jgi:hypothetical protein